MAIANPVELSAWEYCWKPHTPTKRQSRIETQMKNT
jgi:hypothetical protein